MELENQTMIMVTRGDNTKLQDIHSNVLIKQPTLKRPMVSDKFINTSVVENVNGKFYALHPRKLLLRDETELQTIATANDAANKTTYPMSKSEAMIDAPSVTATVDKESLKHDGLAFQKVRYDKKIDAQIWEGKGIINDNIASMLMNARQRKALMVDKSLAQGLVALHTANGVPKAATFVDGTPIYGYDNTPYTMPALVSLTGISLADIKNGTLTGDPAIAAANKLIATIFTQIDEIGDTGLPGKPTENWPYAQGTEIELSVRCHNAVALLLRQSDIYKGNVANYGKDMVENGLSFKINGVSFMVDPAMSEDFIYQLLPLGVNSPVYVPERYAFNAELNPHYAFPNNFWLLTVSMSRDTAVANANMMYTRFGMAKEAGAALPAVFTKLTALSTKVL